MSNVTVDMLKDLIDPEVLLLSLGFNIYYNNNEEIRAPCLIHGGDNKTGFSFRKASKRFYCYTHGCETDSSGETNNDVISLVMQVNKSSFVEAVHYLGQLTGVNVELGTVDEDYTLELKKKKGKNKFVAGVINKAALTELDEDLINVYMSNGAEYFLNKGLTQSFIELYQLGTMIDEFGVLRATIPIRDEHGRLVSISARRVFGNEEPRYRLVKDFQKRRVLYNLHNALEYRIPYNYTIVIVEGFKAVWHVVNSGIPNVVAVMGRSITQAQINLLVKYGYSCVTLLLDGDEKGRVGMEKSLDLLAGKIETRPIYLPDPLSPDDVSHEEIFDLISMFL